MIGERAVLATGTAMKRAQVSRAMKVLEAGGFIERNGNKRLRCISPEVNCGETFSHEETPPKVNAQSTEVNCGETEVNHQLTPSKNQQGKPKRKTNKRDGADFPADGWQMIFASTAYDRLLSFDLLPASMRQKRPDTLQAFAAEFDKLNRIDGHEQDAIAEVMRWLLTAGNWWIDTANFRSVLKLRKPHKDGGTYFDQFLSQAKTNRHARATPTPTRPDPLRPGVDGVRGRTTVQPGRYDYLLNSRRNGAQSVDRGDGSGGDPAPVSVGPPAAQLRRVV
jgi:hypothetical protein